MHLLLVRHCVRTSSAERWQKPDPGNPGHTIAESVMEQFSFRYGVKELWLGVGVTAAWTVVMAVATFLGLIFLDREPSYRFSNPMLSHLDPLQSSWSCTWSLSRQGMYRYYSF